MWQDEEENSENESEGEVEDITELTKPTFVVIAIDTHPLMFKKKEDNSIPFKDCLSACHSLAESLLLTSNSRSWNQFAVLVAREESPCITEFRDNLIDTVKFLNTKANLPNKQLAEEYQRKGDFDLAGFFLACKKVFHDIKTPFYKRTLIYITDDDDPVQDATKRFTALNEVKTFSGNQIDFQIIPTTCEFDYSKFYNELFSLLDNPPVEEICEDREGFIEKLTSAVVMRHSRTNVRFYPFRDDFSRFLKCYKLNIIRSPTLAPTKLTTDGKAVKRIKKNGDELSTSTYFFKGIPGAEEIKFDAYEKANITQNNLPLGLTLLCVSKRMTSVGFILGKPFLLQSKEKEDPFFHKFWKNCVEKERVLVCILKQRSSSTIRYVELIPNVANNISVFLVKCIPFYTELIHPDITDYHEYETNRKQEEAIRKVVEALSFDFNLRMIPDPSLRKKKEYVKAKLLEEAVDEAINVTFDVKALHEQLSEAAQAVSENFTFVENKKRKGASEGSKSKKVK